MMKLLDAVSRSVKSETNFFRGAFLAKLRKELAVRPECTDKTSSIAIYQKTYE